MTIVRAHEEDIGRARVIDVHTPELALAAGLPEYPGFDLLSLRPDGERDIEVKGRARVGEIELSENEWARAATLRDRYWLYVVFDCATDRPRLHVVRDPFRQAAFAQPDQCPRCAGRDPAALRGRRERTMTFPKSAARRTRRFDEAREGGTMADPKTPEPEGEGEPLEGLSDLEKLLALMREWRSEPDDGEDQTAIVTELDRALEEDPLRLREPDLSDSEEGHEPLLC